MLYVLTHKAEKQLRNCSDSHRLGPLSCEKFKLSTTTCSSVVPAPLRSFCAKTHCAVSPKFIQVMIMCLVSRCMPAAGGCEEYNVISVCDFPHQGSGLIPKIGTTLRHVISKINEVSRGPAGSPILQYTY